MVGDPQLKLLIVRFKRDTGNVTRESEHCIVLPSICQLTREQNAGFLTLCHLWFPSTFLCALHSPSEFLSLDAQGPAFW